LRIRSLLAIAKSVESLVTVDEFAHDKASQSYKCSSG
jgi:hypothetical protein